MAAKIEADTVWQGRVVKVIDGDSLRVRRGAAVFELRLYGIDTPEYKQPWSNKAKQKSKSLLDGENVMVTVMDVDRYHRTVALVSVNGILVNAELVKNGLAWVYTRYCLADTICDEFKFLEQKARKAHLGLWRDKNPIPPWQWKQNHPK